MVSYIAVESDGTYTGYRPIIDSDSADLSYGYEFDTETPAVVADYSGGYMHVGEFAHVPQESLPSFYRLVRQIMEDMGVDYEFNSETGDD